MFHRDEHALVERADVVDCDDMRVGELGHRLRFSPQAVLELRIAVTSQHLERDDAIELRIARRVDHAHSPGTDLVHDHIASESRTGRDHVIGARLDRWIIRSLVARER